MAADPTYLFCVGATKSGTTWLYRHLRAHPDCHFRSIKELHYFDMSRPEHFANARRKLEAPIAALEEELQMGDPAKAAARAGKLADLWDWDEVLERGEIDLPAYRAFLLGGRNGQALVGDVTPAYAMLPVKRLKQIAEVGQPFRVLLLMRDPVARTWSHIRMVAARAGEAFEATARALLARMVADDLTGEGKGIAQRGDYASIVTRLKKAFPAEVLHLEFYERLLSPEGLHRLWGRLGIGPGPATFEDRVYASPKLKMTEAETGALRRWLRPQYEFISGLMPDLPEAWRANMEEGLA